MLTILYSFNDRKQKKTEAVLLKWTFAIDSYAEYQYCIESYRITVSGGTLKTQKGTGYPAFKSFRLSFFRICYWNNVPYRMLSKYSIRRYPGYWVSVPCLQKLSTVFLSNMLLVNYNTPYKKTSFMKTGVWPQRGQGSNPWITWGLTPEGSGVRPQILQYFSPIQIPHFWPHYFTSW